MKIKCIVAALTASMALSIYAEVGVMATRYGEFQIKKDSETKQQTAYFNHKVIMPRIEGNNSLTLLGRYTIGTADILLIQDNGGSACPAQLNFINIGPDQQIKVSPVFGSCSDLVKVRVKSDRIIVSMPHFSPIPESKKLNQKKIYEYDGQVITENGKALKSRERY